MIYDFFFVNGSDLDFNPFNGTEDENYYDCKLDPDNEYLNKINIDCKYYTDRNFECIIENSYGLSIVHCNCRSIRKHFETINEYLLCLPVKFDAIV